VLTNFNEILEATQKNQTIKISVAAAQDEHVLKAVYQAFKEGIAEAILVGNKEEIEKCMDICKIPHNTFEIVDVKGDLEEQSKKAVDLIMEGKAQVLMKGLVDTSIILKAVLREKSLRTGRVMSSVAVMETENYHKLLLLSDPAMNIKPDLDAKKQIIENTNSVAQALGIEKPKVAILCAKEKVDLKMPETIDAQNLVEMNGNGELKDCIIGGPFALDNIVSKAAAEHKGINHPVAGDADVILAPELVSANTLYKSMVFLGNAKSAGVIVGAKMPIILTSRADSEETKLNAIAVAALIANRN